MPKVSVIVPNYNHARFLRKRIDSILAQTFQDFELILLDDCSTDDSRPILTSYAADPHVRAVEFNKKNSGSTFKQWNKGVRLAHGEYIWIAESDDYADQRFLERLVTALDANPKAVFVSCRSWRVDANDKSNGYGDSDLPHLARYAVGAATDGREECQNYLVRICTIYNASSVLLRKSVYDSVGGADERLRFCGDWKLWAAMALTGSVIYLSDPLNYYRVHQRTVTAKSNEEALAQAEYLRVVRWVLARVTPPEAAQHELREALPGLWAPAVTTWHVPLGRRWSILWDAVAIDRVSTLRRILPVGLGALRRKFLRHWQSIRSATKTT